MTRPIHGDPATDAHPAADDATDLQVAAAGIGEDVDAAIAFAVEQGYTLPHPGGGDTARRWHRLAAVARGSLTVARVLEAHTDALAVLAESGRDDPAPGSWGVFAAEAPGVQVIASTAGDGRVTLSGTKPWCSLAGALDHALVTAHGDGGRRLYAVDLHHPGARARPAHDWAARGLRTVPSTGLDLDAVPARPIGAPGWYLDRPGFAWGGAGVAACWYGGALGVADTVHAASRTRAGGELATMHVGALDVALTGARCTLADAAAAVDAGRADGHDGALLALRVRGVVVDAVERVLHTAGHALGPGPLAFDPAHAARVADLELYVRQHHGERDLATLGAALVGRSA